ncbi:MAG: WbqC family protein [Bacteroidetes bacterium]|nr:WbqC family protein [Bacteroidota bacterium]
MSALLLSTAYLPPVAYLQKIKNNRPFFIEKHEHYQKQSYRNRCTVLTANGVLPLSVPITQTHQKQVVSTVRISYSEKWQQKHWRAITSAYRNTPYFMYYEDAIQPFYQRKYDFLLDYNTEWLQVLLRLFKIDTPILFTENYEKDALDVDFRNILHPKNIDYHSPCKPYAQLFSERFGFQENLSCIDLLFNQGNHAASFL